MRSSIKLFLLSVFTAIVHLLSWLRISAPRSVRAAVLFGVVVCAFALNIAVSAKAGHAPLMHGIWITAIYGASMLVCGVLFHRILVRTELCDTIYWCDDQVDAVCDLVDRLWEKLRRHWRPEAPAVTEPHDRLTAPVDPREEELSVTFEEGGDGR